MVKIPSATAGDIRDSGSILRLERSTGGGQGNPLQYSCLENSMEFHGTPESGGLQSIGLQRVTHDLSNQAYIRRVLLYERHLTCVMIDKSYILGMNLLQQQGYHN